MPLKKPQIPLRRYSGRQIPAQFIDIWGVDSLPSNYTGNTYFSLNEVRDRNEWNGDNQIKNESGDDLQLKTGKAVQFDSANSDYAIGDVDSITYPFTMRQIVRIDDLSSTSNTGGIIKRSAGNQYFNLLFRINGVVDITRRNTSTVNTSTQLTVVEDLFYDIVIVFNSETSVTFYYNGGNKEELTGLTSVSVTSDFDAYIIGGLREQSFSGSNSTANLFQLYNYAVTDNQVLSGYQNPQIPQYEGVEPIVDIRFIEDEIDVDGTFLNYGSLGDGANATFKSTAVSPYNPTINGLSTGFQLGLSGFNRYSSITTPTLSPTGDYIVTGNNYNSTTDLFGNSFQKPFINGVLNFPSQDSNQSSSLDLGVNKTVIFFINTTDLTQVIFNTTSGGGTISATAGTVSDSTGTFNIDGSIISGEGSYIVLADSTGLDLDSFSVDDEMNGQIAWTTFSKLVGESELNSIKVYFNDLV